MGIWGWILNLIFPIDWIFWGWLSNIWNVTWYAIIIVMIAVFYGTIFAILVASVGLFITLFLGLLGLFVMLDGPILINIILFFLVMGFLLFFTVLTSPIWLVIISIIVPFEELFYIWLLLLIVIFLWEVVLPIFGAGLTQTEI